MLFSERCQHSLWLVSCLEEKNGLFLKIAFWIFRLVIWMLLHCCNWLALHIWPNCLFSLNYCVCVWWVFKKNYCMHAETMPCCRLLHTVISESLLFSWSCFQHQKSAIFIVSHHEILAMFLQYFSFWLFLALNLIGPNFILEVLSHKSSKFQQLLLYSYYFKRTFIRKKKTYNSNILIKIVSQKQNR